MKKLALILLTMRLITVAATESTEATTIEATTSNSTPSINTCEMRKLLGTHQFVIITNQACNRMLEIYPNEDGQCPQSLKHIWKPSSRCTMNGLQAHVVRDVHGKSPPAILYISKGPANGRIFVSLDRIEWPETGSNMSLYALPEVKASSMSEKPIGNAGPDEWKHTIVDTRLRFLYVITHAPHRSNSGQLVVYMIESQTDKTRTFPQLIRFAVRDQAMKMDSYVADPYAHLVYFTQTKASGGMDVYKVHMDHFLQFLVNDAPTEFVTSFAEERMLISVTDGILVSRSKGNSITTMFRNLNLKDSSDVHICEHGAFSGSEANFLILKGWDYCMMRWGMDRDLCDQDSGQAEKIPIENTSSTPLLMEEETDWKFILLVAIITLLLIIFVLFLIALARLIHYRNMYADTKEKNNFLQDQVASALPYYPTNAGHTSVLDITVDRFNC